MRGAARGARCAVGLTIFSLIAGPPPAAAQAAPDTLTLDEALVLARSLNPAYRRAVAQTDASGAQVTAGVGAFLPSLNGSVSFNGSSSTRITGEDDFGQPVELADPITFESSAAFQSLSAQLTLFDGFRNLSNLRAARAGAEAADAALGGEALRIAADVTRRFYEAVERRDLIGVEERLLAIRREQLAMTERLFRVAQRTQLDVLGADAEVAQQELALEAARGEARKAVLRLGEAIGLDEPARFEVAGELPEPFDPLGLDAESLVARALEASPRIAQARADERRAAASAAAARGGWWPTVSAAASFSRSVSRSSFDALFDLNPRNHGFGFGLSVSVPLFDRFQTMSAAAQAGAAERAAEESLREARLRLETDVRQGFVDVQTAYRQVRLAERALDLSRRRLAMAQEQFRQGAIGFVELQQVVDQAARDERGALDARLRFANAVVTLEELVGEPVR